jgi:hypothetical protein
MGLAQKPEYVMDFEKYYKHVDSICTKLNYIREMFEGGKEKRHILGAVVNLHRPGSYWDQKRKEARGSAQAAPKVPDGG